MSANDKTNVPDPMTIETPDVKTRSTRDLLDAIEAYRFKSGGHPLKNCVEWIELRRRLNLS